MKSNSKMYHSSRRESKIRKTRLPIEVKKQDISNLREIVTCSVMSDFRRAGKPCNLEEIEKVVDEKIESAANHLRLMYSDLATYNSEEIIVMTKKREHFNSIRRNINTGITAILGLNVMTSTKVLLLSSFLTTVKDNNDDISKFLCKYFEPDLSIEEEIDNDDNQIVISSEGGNDFVSILNKFKVPPAVSADIGDLYKNGLSVPTIFSLATALATKFITPPDDEAGAFAIS